MPQILSVFFAVTLTHIVLYVLRQFVANMLIDLASLCYALLYHCRYRRSWSYLCGWSSGSYCRSSGQGHRRPCFLLGRLFVWSRPPSIWVMRQATMCPTWAAIRLAPTPVHLAMATGVHVSYLSSRSSRSDGSPSGRCDGLLGQPFVRPSRLSMLPWWSYLGGWSSGSDRRPSGRGHRRPCVLLGRLFVWFRPPSIWALRQATICPLRPTWAAVRLVPTAVHLGVATSDHMSYLGGRSSGSDFRPSGYEDRCPCVLCPKAPCLFRGLCPPNTQTRPPLTPPILRWAGSVHVD